MYLHTLKGHHHKQINFLDIFIALLNRILYDLVIRILALNAINNQVRTYIHFSGVAENILIHMYHGL